MAGLAGLFTVNGLSSGYGRTCGGVAVNYYVLYGFRVGDVRKLAGLLTLQWVLKPG